jgi:CheY-like chemotaxis protein
MPEMNGFQLCSRIIATQNGWCEAMKKNHYSMHRYKADKMCPIVAVTAFTNENVVV